MPSFSWAESIGVYKAFLKWYRTDCLYGPLVESPNMTCSMVFAVPKPTPGEFRGILNLSDRSVTGTSINDCLHKKFKTVEYIAQCEIIERMIAVGKGAWLWVKDLEDGFHNVPIHNDDIFRLCIRFEGKIYAFQRLPMGLSSSPNLFTEFMHFPLWAVANHEGPEEMSDDESLYYLTIDSRIVDISHFREAADLTQIGSSPFYRMSLIDSYVDDIFGLHIDKAKSWLQWFHSESVFNMMNLKCKSAKGRKPAQVNILLGKEYDLNRQWVRLSDEKHDRYHSFFSAVLQWEWISELVLLSIIGKARHVATIYKPLAAFARGLEFFIPYHSVKERGHKLGRGPSIRNDWRLKARLQCLIDCMEIANRVGVPFSYFVRMKDLTPDIRIVTDASMLIGAGGIASDGSYFQTRWSDIDLNIVSRDERDIQWRELVAIYGCLLSLSTRHGSAINDSLIEVFTDNVACKYMLINMTAKLTRPDLQILIDEICKLCVTRRIHLWMEHIPGDENKVADALSRFFEKPLELEQLEKHSVGPLSNDQSVLVSKLIQQGANRSARHLKEGNYKILRKYQEFPERYFPEN